MRNHDAEGDATIDMRSLCAGAGIVLIGRGLLTRLLLLKLRRDVKRLNAGDHRPLLRGYADDAVLHFNDGPHRWSGEHRGKAAIERFLRDFVGAGLQGEIRALWIAGPPWALTMVARFDDRAISPAGDEIYANRTVWSSGLAGARSSSTRTSTRARRASSRSRTRCASSASLPSNRRKRPQPMGRRTSGSGFCIVASVRSARVRRISGSTCSMISEARRSACQALSAGSSIQVSVSSQ
jgi:hypothetical protein